jgi:protocatechuate 3,4-dioxygenase beta subunit
MRLIIIIMMWATYVCADTASRDATQPPRDELVIPIDCKLTPVIEPSTQAPKSFVFSNNLRRPTGLVKESAGTATVIFGRVFDKNCLPIANACVGLWQNDNEGHPPGKSKEFQGSGMSCTDTNGHFSFVTILPKVEEKTKLAKLFYTISHPLMSKPFTSTLLLNPHNDTELPSKVQKHLHAIIYQPTIVNSANTHYYYPDLVIDLTQPFRQY